MSGAGKVVVVGAVVLGQHRHDATAGLGPGTHVDRGRVELRRRRAELGRPHVEAEREHQFAAVSACCGQGQGDVERTEHTRSGRDHVRNGVDDPHRGGHHRARPRLHSGDAGRGRVVERAGHVQVDVRVALDLDAVTDVVICSRPVGRDVAGHPRHVLDRDGFAPVDDADRLDANRAGGSGFDRAARHFERSFRRRALDRLAQFLDLRAERVGHEPNTAGPLVDDDTGDRDERFVVHGPAEAHAVHHHVGHRVVVVEADLVRVDGPDRARLRGQHQRELIEREARLDP